jgi:hypothetical protein
MRTSIKKLFTISFISITFGGIIFSSPFANKSISTLANSNLTISFNHGLADGTSLTNASLLSIVNSTAKVGSSTVSVATQTNAINVLAKTTGTEPNINGFLRVEQTQAGTAEIEIYFNLNYAFYKSISISASKQTGNGNLAVFVNGSTTALTTFAPSGSGFVNYSVNSPDTITRIRFVPQTNQNIWDLDSVTLGSVDLAILSQQVLSYTMQGCNLDTGDNPVITKQLTDSEITDLANLYNSLSSTEKDTFRNTYPQAWGRMKWMFDRKAISYS